MTFKEILKNFGSGSKERKERFKELQEEDRLNEMLEDRKKSANERELERFQKEHREKQIKEALNEFRKEREYEDNFLHNPLDAPNITKGSSNLLKEKNMFNNKGNMFTHQEMIHKGNPNLMNNGKVLK